MENGEIRLRVRYAETDQMGIVYHANYLVWMEMGRVELFRARGFRYRDLEAEDQIYLAVVEAQCRYLAPARYDDEVDVGTRVLASGSRLVHFGYEMRHAHRGTLLATGETKHLFVNAEMRTVRLPPRYQAVFAV